jgi:osmotically-inducible protein OsmY
MNDRNMEDRERRWRNQENDDDWDWYYYEYRYVPYSSRENFGEQDRFGRSQGQSYGRDYGRDYGRNYNWDYGTNYESDYETYGTSTWNRGRYSGVGPRGYRRSDDRIEEDVNDRLTWHGEIDATDIQVDVNDGIVTLKGEVNSRYEKRMAENVAENVSGVWDVNNNLRINRQTDWNRSLGGGTNTEMRDQIRERMKVVGQDGEEVGEVKEIRSNDFLVDRTMARDVYIPFQAAHVMDDRIRLNVRAGEVDDQGWEMPELLDMGEETSSRKRR